jgi:beta-phosphoglucomutase-like phosphatase (HAD superfamily)
MKPQNMQGVKSNLKKLDYMMRAAIFDFDGVLFDSVSLHEQGWRHIAQEEKKSFTRKQFEQGIGVKNQFFVKEILQWASDSDEIARIMAYKEMIFQRLVNRRRKISRSLMRVFRVAIRKKI